MVLVIFTEKSALLANSSLGAIKITLTAINRGKMAKIAEGLEYSYQFS